MHSAQGSEETIGFFRLFCPLFQLLGKVGRRRPSSRRRRETSLYCAFKRTGSTIYKKLSPPSTGVMTQGEILVFSAMQTLSAGA